MRFELRHHLPKPARRAFEILFSEVYRRASSERSKVQQTLTEEGERNGRRFRRYRITSTRELPGPLAKLLGGDTLSYELEESFDDANLRMDWKVIPSRLAEKVSAEGSYELLAGKGEAECERVIRGEVRVSIALVGGKVEKLIGEEIESSYARGAEFARQWLAQND